MINFFPESFQNQMVFDIFRLRWIKLQNLLSPKKSVIFSLVTVRGELVAP